MLMLLRPLLESWLSVHIRKWQKKKKNDRNIIIQHMFVVLHDTHTHTTLHTFKRILRVFDDVNAQDSVYHWKSTKFNVKDSLVF